MTVYTENTPAATSVQGIDLFKLFYLVDAYVQRGIEMNIPITGGKGLLTKRKSDPDPHSIGKLLLNGWGAEYALNITPVVNDERYLKSSLNWTFPQAYYSVLFTARAFLAIQGKESFNESIIRKNIGHYVCRYYYPYTLSYQATGSIRTYQVRDLASSASEIGDYLRIVRAKQIDTYVGPVTDPDEAAIRKVTKEIGYTTFLDLLCLLRITSASPDTAGLSLSGAEVSQLHGCLSRLVAYVNTVHELYVAKRLGIDAYRDIVNELPTYLREGFVGDRLNNSIIPILSIV